MLLYLNVLKLFLINKELYLRYNSLIDLEFVSTNYPELAKLWMCLNHLRKTTDKETLNDADLTFCLLTLYPKVDRRIFDPLINKVELTEPNPDSAVEYLEGLRKRQAATEFGFLALDVAEGKKPLAALQVACTEFMEHSAPRAGASLEGTFVSDDIEVLYQSAVAEGGLNWRLPSLNRALGPLRKGDFGFIFARPESGKTTFLASEVTNFAEQAKAPILWFNNEEQGDKVGIRIYQASLGATLEQVTGNRPRAREAYYKKTNRLLKLIDNATITKSEIEAYCREFKPCMIVVDQLDKVKGFSADREDLMLGAIYQWARELAKQYGAVIGVSQSDGSGEGIKYLHMGNVANAKTSKQAEADWIMGIGVSYTDYHPNIRGFSVCKNKLIGGDMSVPQMRHGKWEVMLKPEIARYEDLV